jgi:hypothetical protein
MRDSNERHAHPAVRTFRLVRQWNLAAANVMGRDWAAVMEGMLVSRWGWDGISYDGGLASSWRTALARAAREIRAQRRAQ